MRIGVLTGLTVEARLLHGSAFEETQAPLIARAGACAKRAADEAERLVGLGAGALVSFGIAAGLDARLRVGDLVFANRVILPDGGSFDTDPDWLESARTQHGRPGARSFIGPVAGTDRLLASAADKRSLAARSGALCGDMESAAAATVAARAGLPLLVVRAISDSAAQTLPSVARVPLRPDGGISIGPVVLALWTKPGEWPAVARLALDTRAALAALRGVVRSGALGPPGRSGRRLDGLAHQPIEDVLGRPLPV